MGRKGVGILIVLWFGGGCGDGGPGGGAVVALALGEHHTCVLLEAGQVRCWGANDKGQLGYGNTENIGDDETAESVGNVPLGAPAVQISAGGGPPGAGPSGTRRGHTCAVLETGAVRCWGAASHGQLGYGNTENVGDDETPESAGDVPLGAPAIQVAAGGLHTCALLEGGAVRCWGDAVHGQLGYDSIEIIGDDETPESVGNVPLGAPAVEIAAGGMLTCARFENGAFQCWGFDGKGSLGAESASDLSLGATVEIEAGGWHTCARRETGSVQCHGFNYETPGDVPVAIPAVEVAAGGFHICLLLATGALRCWGSNGYGQLGYTYTRHIADNEPLFDVPLGARAVEIAAGGMHTCARLETGALRCWGRGESGQLGYGNTENIGDDEDPAEAGDVPLD